MTTRKRNHAKIRERVASRRGHWGKYPTAEEARASVNPQIRLKVLAVDALERYARSGPWRGSDAERYAKASRLLSRLSHAYQIPEPTLITRPRMKNRGGCTLGSERATIVVERPISVITLLHEFAHARGKTEAEAVAWSLSIFARFWPRSFARLTIGDQGTATVRSATGEEIDDAIARATVEAITDSLRSVS